MHPPMWSRAEAKKWIEKTCGTGWLPMVDEVYDRLPAHLNITQAFQKWGTLQFDLDKEDVKFEAFLEEIEIKSGSICEKCGAPGKEEIVDGWVYTRCANHLS